MAEHTKEYTLKINGIKESVKDTQSLNDALGKNSKEYKSTSDAMNDYYNLQKKVKDATSANAKEQKTGTQSLREMNQALKELKGQMVGLEQNSAQWKALAKEAGNLKDKISDANSAIKRFASDAKVMDDVINLAKSATAAFQLYKGAMSAFGMETEKAEKAMQTLVGAMSIIQSLQTLQNTLKGCTATSDLLSKALKVTGAGLVTNQLASIKATVAAEGLSKTQKALTLTTKSLSLALKAIPLMLVIGLITELVLHWEDLVGWFNETFPVLKKMGGAFNALKAVIVGVGKAIVHWLTNPIKTIMDVFQKALSGDFAGAVKAAVDGVKNQFTGLGDAFKEGFTNQVNEGLEEMARKQAETDDEMLTHHKNMITKQKNDDGTYRKEYIEANKKMFENRKKMYKKDSKEYRKVLEEEAAFNQQIEDAKTAAAQKGAKEREKAAKEAAKAAAKEAAEAAKAEEEERKRLLTAERELTKAVTDRDILEQKVYERRKQRIAEGYNAGPVETYEKKLDDLYKTQKKISDLELAKTITELSEALADNVKYLNKGNKVWQEYQNNVFYATKEVAKNSGHTEAAASKIALAYTKKTENIWSQLLASLIGKTDEEALKIINSLGLNDADLNVVLAGWQKMQGLILKTEDETNAKIIEKENNMLSVRKAELADFADDFKREYEKLINRVKDSKLEEPVRNKIFGYIDKEETLKNLELLRTQWDKSYIVLEGILNKEEQRWNEYLEEVKKIYSEDSSAFKKAQKEKADALNPLREKLLEVGQKAKNPTSTEVDYNNNGTAESSTKPQRKLWYGKGEKDDSGKEYSLIDNLSNLFQSLDEMVLAPAMDTFAMYMDFAIEETEQKLAEVEKLHDKALDKVDESAEKIKELNDSLKDSSNTNIEVTKQQLADEELLYAQRLAEEKKLAEEEKALKNKQAKQEAQARKMELGYQMVMAVANTAQGASKALAQWGWPLGAVFAGVMAALGAIQVALIAKQIGAIKPVKYAEGGLLQGPSHSQGGIRLGNIEVEGGEAVINKRSTERYRGLLDAINAAGNGGKHTLADKKIRRYADGGQLNFDRADENLRTNANTNRLINAIDGINMQPVVSVKDIWKAEDRLVHVRSLAGKTTH